MSCLRPRGLVLAWIVSSALLVGGALSAATASAAGEPKLLLLPIVVHSAEDPEYLRNGLNDMLTARLARIGAIDLLQPQGKTADRGTTRVEQARELGRKAGADFVLFGSFTRFGQGASLDVQCAPVDPAAVGARAEPLREIFVHSGSIGEIIPDLDELAGKVSRFARGELVVATGPAGPPGAGVGASAARELQDLRARVAALESALTQLLENGENATGEATAPEDLR